ncbi:hypothetical protein TWF281_000087 [Arthrobotrys megalospora]
MSGGEIIGENEASSVADSALRSTSTAHDGTSPKTPSHSNPSLSRGIGTQDDESLPDAPAISSERKAMPPPPLPKSLRRSQSASDLSSLAPSKMVLSGTTTKPMTIREWRAAARSKKAAENSAKKENEAPRVPPKPVQIPQPRPVERKPQTQAASPPTPGFINPIDALLGPKNKEMLLRAREARAQMPEVKLDPVVAGPVPFRVEPEWYKEATKQVRSGPQGQQMSGQFGSNFNPMAFGPGFYPSTGTYALPGPNAIPQQPFNIPNMQFPPIPGGPGLGFNTMGVQYPGPMNQFQVSYQNFGPFASGYPAIPHSMSNQSFQPNTSQWTGTNSSNNEMVSEIQVSSGAQSETSDAPGIMDIPSTEAQVVPPLEREELGAKMDIDMDLDTHPITGPPQSSEITEKISTESEINTDTGRNSTDNLPAPSLRTTISNKEGGVAMAPKDATVSGVETTTVKDGENNPRITSQDSNDNLNFPSSTGLSVLLGETPRAATGERGSSPTIQIEPVAAAISSTGEFGPTNKIIYNASEVPTGAIPEPVQPAQNMTPGPEIPPPLWAGGNMSMNMNPMGFNGLPFGPTNGVGGFQQPAPMPMDMDTNMMPANPTISPPNTTKDASADSPTPRFPWNYNDNLMAPIPFPNNRQTTPQRYSMQPNTSPSYIPWAGPPEHIAPGRRFPLPIQPRKPDTPSPPPPSRPPVIPGLEDYTPPDSTTFIGYTPPELAEFEPEELVLPWTVFYSSKIVDMRNQVMGVSPLEAKIPFPDQWQERRWITGEEAGRIMRGENPRGRAMRGRMMRGGRGVGRSTRGGRGGAMSTREAPSSSGTPSPGISSGTTIKRNNLGTITLEGRMDSEEGKYTRDASGSPSKPPQGREPSQPKIIGSDSEPEVSYRPKLVPQSILNRPADPASIPLPGPTEEEYDIIMADGSDDSDESENSPYHIFLSSTNVAKDPPRELDGEVEEMLNKYIEIGSSSENSEDEEGDSKHHQHGDSDGEDSDELSSEDDDDDSSEEESQKKPGKAKQIPFDFDAYWKENPLEPEFEARMLEHSQPFIDKCIAEHEANAAAEEARKQKIAELCAPPKFIGPAPQLQVKGQNKRVSYVDTNGGKPAESAPLPPPVKQAPKRVSFLDVNAGKSPAAIPSTEKNDKEVRPLPTVTKSPLAGFGPKRAPQAKKSPKKSQTKPPKEVAGNIAMPPPPPPPQNAITSPTVKKGRVSILELQAKKQKQLETMGASPAIQTRETAVSDEKPLSSTELPLPTNPVDEEASLKSQPKKPTGDTMMELDDDCMDVTS